MLEYHTSGPFNNSDASGRVNYYGLEYVPTAIFDGTNWYVGGSNAFNAYNTRYNQQIAIGTPGVLSLKIVNYNPALRTGTITAKFQATEQMQESSVNLRFAITESHKFYQWQWLDSLQFIMRDMLPDHVGVGFWVDQGETYVDSQSFYIDPDWVDRHCELVVFVQSDKGKQVLISNLIPLYQTHVSGDANGDRAVTVSDVVFLTNYILYGGVEPRPSASGDPNEDCVIDVADVIFLMNYVFLGGPAPLRGWEID
ncbi:MAG: dockerin type I repeat-containing protein [Candidatus Zixiibacteriota bacterium]